VLLSDAAAVAALVGAAAVARSRRAGPSFAAIAWVAALGLAPGTIAVAREERAHRPGETGAHGMSGTVLLFAAGFVINTVGTVLILVGPPQRRARRRSETAVDVALLIAGNAIGVPYLSLVRTLHEGEAAGAS
jgi:hypothetical protein